MTASEIFEAGMEKRCRNPIYNVQPRLVNPSTGASTDVPCQPVTLREVFGITHGDHGIVNQGEIALTFDDEGCTKDERQVENSGCCQN